MNRESIKGILAVNTATLVATWQSTATSIESTLKILLLVLTILLTARKWWIMEKWTKANNSQLTKTPPTNEEI